MMGKRLKLEERGKTKLKRKKETISLIEAEPQDSWFVWSKSRSGREVVYLRFQITGQHPRLYGPFTSKRQALEFLDKTIERLLDAMSMADSDCSDLMLDEEFRRIWPPIVEYPILEQLSQAKKPQLNAEPLKSARQLLVNSSLERNGAK
jgi:hypothetical protein